MFASPPTPSPLYILFFVCFFFHPEIHLFAAA
jgi:hypothetical protein